MEVYDQDAGKDVRFQFESFVTVRTGAGGVVQAIATDRAGREYEVGYVASPPTVLWVSRRVGTQSTLHEYLPQDETWRRVQRHVASSYYRNPVYHAGIRGEGSVKIHPSWRPGMRRNSIIQKFLGIAHAEGTDVMFGQDSARSIGIYVSKETGESPADVDAQIADLKLGDSDPRITFVVVHGTKDFIERYMNDLRYPDIFIAVADESILKQLPVVIMDEGWQPGDPPADIDEMLYSGSKQAQQPPRVQQPQAPKVPQAPPAPQPPPPPPAPLPEPAVVPEPAQAPPGVPGQDNPQQYLQPQTMRPPVQQAPSVRPRTVTRSAATGGGGFPVIEEAGGRTIPVTGSVITPPPEAPPEVLEADDEDDEQMAVHAQRVLAGQDEVEVRDEERPTWSAGLRVKEAATEDMGTIQEMQSETLALVSFDTGGTSLIPVNELDVVKT